MSTEIKKRIVLASVLKPVDDTRMLEKLGATLVANDYEVFIIGYPSSEKITEPGINILSLPTFERLSFRRILVPWTIFKKINRLKPDVVIANTPELLLILILSKLFFGRKIVYDILENYYRNILHTKTYPWIVRWILAIWSRLVEVISAPFIDGFILAEKGYQNELSFTRNAIVLQNKLPKKTAQRFEMNHSKYFNLLFTGTLAPSTGILEAIRLAKELHAINSSYTLTIIGYAALVEVRSQITQEISNAPFIKLIGGDRLVPHNLILEEISKAGTGIIIYPQNPGTSSSIPTKLYEYLALKLPVIISHTNDSTELVTRCNAGIVIEDGLNPIALNTQLINGKFVFNCPEEIFWESEAPKLLDLLKI